MNNASEKPVRHWLPIALWILAAALVALGWAVWKTEYAWRDGYGDGDMSELRMADPRALTAGDMTTFHKGFKPFGQAAENLPWQYEKFFDDGDGLFERPFQPAIQRIRYNTRDGLGPLYNADACGACHFRDGSVEEPYTSGQIMNGIFLRMSVTDGKGGWAAPAGYHSQLRDKAVAGVPPEGFGVIDWHEIPGRFPDGEAYSLRKPSFRVLNPAYGELPDGVIFEARSAPRLPGMGLLEAIDETTLLAIAKSQANHPDGVSGRPNWLTDPETGKRVIGKFSLKANSPHLRDQAAGAAFNDMGVTSPLHPRELCLAGQTACSEAPAGGTPEAPDLSEEQLHALTVYLQLLAVPARRNLDDTDVGLGGRLFAEVGCSACHLDTVRTGNSHPIKRLRGQTIHPYSDLLLHDMGPDLAGRPDGEASAQEWRTPPLWGIGLTRKSNHHTVFLHDQRARSVQEAILWHGGEASAAKTRFMALNQAKRAALIKFLESI